MPLLTCSMPCTTRGSCASSVARQASGSMRHASPAPARRDRSNGARVWTRSLTPSSARTRRCRRQPVGRRPAPALRGSAVARRAAIGARARTPAAAAGAGRWDGVVLAGREAVSSEPAGDVVRLLAPFDPVVWDRRRFEMLWGWAYRFEAYTPTSKRKLGYYALADAVARPHRRLGQRLEQRQASWMPNAATCSRAARAIAGSRPRSRQNSNGCACS